jgi:hypothetical protein
MKPSKLHEALHALIGERVPLHIWGTCGVGMSQIVSQVANDLDYDFLDVRAVQLDPVDLRGLPRISGIQTEWVPPKFLPTAGKGGRFRVRLNRLLWLPGSLVRREGGFSVNHLRQLMLEELHRRNFADTTIRRYMHGVTHFSRYFRRPPDQLGPEEIRKYQADLFTQFKFSPNTVILRLASLRFFYIHVEA